jgi:hypothetical protein
MSGLHSDLVTIDLHGPFTYELDHDPTDDGPVRIHDYWLDLSSGPPWLVYRRNDANDGWEGVGGSGGGGPVRRDFEYQRQTDQTIPDSTNTAVSFTATFNIDNGSWFSIGQPTRFTCPSDAGASDGDYYISASVRWTGNNVGIRQVFIVKNGTDTWALEQREVGSADAVMSCSGMVPLVGGDYLEMFVEQESGGGLDIISSNFFSPTIRGFKIN